MHPQAGQAAPPELLVDLPRLISDFFSHSPNLEDPSQRVLFGTSGHRGSSLRRNFNEAHILAITQAVCEIRVQEGVDGPLFLGKDTHALSEPAQRVALQVLAAHGVEVRWSEEFTPTPALSLAILDWNRGRSRGLADGILITPSHNPPEDGGFKYNPSHGGPAGSALTQRIETRANELLSRPEKVLRLPLSQALKAKHLKLYDFRDPYLEALSEIVDMEAIAASGLRIGVDPMGGAALGYWAPMAERYRLNIDVVNPYPDPRFAFMSLDLDGKIRMDCSSPYAMAGLIQLKDRYDIAFGNDADSDRHGIVTPSVGLMNPNHYLSVAIDYLFKSRGGWPSSCHIGKSLVSSGMIDRVAARLEREVSEVPVGFKWFVEGLSSGACGFAGEESAGATFLRRDAGVWTTDKDGLLLNLLAAEITAKTGRDPGAHYQELVEIFGEPVYERLSAPASLREKKLLSSLSPEQVKAETLAGDPILSKLSRAPGNGAAIGGLKVSTAQGWFAARPSGTEEIYKIYSESFKGRAHLKQIQEEAQSIVQSALSS